MVWEAQVKRGAGPCVGVEANISAKPCSTCYKVSMVALVIVLACPKIKRGTRATHTMPSATVAPIVNVSVVTAVTEATTRLPALSSACHQVADGKAVACPANHVALDFFAYSVTETVASTRALLCCSDR